MASVLAAQLAQLAPREKYVRGKASLLFSYQQAADVGADTLLSIAETGALPLFCCCCCSTASPPLVQRPS